MDINKASGGLPPAAGQTATIASFTQELICPLLDTKLTLCNRRPPKDPVNSLLSFGYMLLLNNVMSLILAEELNPYLGNLHRSDRKEPHLAFYLTEEFWATVVDSLVMTLINKFHREFRLAC